MFDVTLHLLHSIKSFPVNDGLMSIFHQVHGKLSIILFFLPRQEIRSVGLLHQYLAYILLVAQHPVDGGGAPLGLSSYRLDTVGFQILLDFPNAVPLHIEVENQPNDLGLLGYDLQCAVRPFV